MLFKKSAVAEPKTKKAAPDSRRKPAGAAAKRPAEQSIKKENKLVRYFKEVRAELRKVIWPTRQTTLRLTGIVLSVTLATSVFLGAVDFLFSKLISLILSI